MSNIEDLAREFLEAAEALHETHSNTDVHRKGGMAGQAITAHCAWECHVVESVDGKWQRFHHEALTRYNKAAHELGAALS